MAVLIVSFNAAIPYSSAESSAVKPLTPAQEAVWDEHEELYDKLSATSPSQYPNLIARLQNLLKKQETAFGPNSPQVSCTLDQLWPIYKLQNKPLEQIKVAKRSLEIKRKILGAQAVDTAMLTCHLANSMVANHQCEDALALLQNYLKTLPETETRSAEIMTIYEIAQTYCEWKKYEQAQPWFEKALDLKRKYDPRSRVYPSYKKALIAAEANSRHIMSAVK